MQAGRTRGILNRGREEIAVEKGEIVGGMGLNRGISQKEQWKITYKKERMLEGALQYGIFKIKTLPGSMRYLLF